jgi:hypothetical protein
MHQLKAIKINATTRILKVAEAPLVPTWISMPMLLYVSWFSTDCSVFSNGDTVILTQGLGESRLMRTRPKTYSLVGTGNRVTLENWKLGQRHSFTAYPQRIRPKLKKRLGGNIKLYIQRKRRKVRGKRQNFGS